jgi:pimeloyl-ACP methyl ester carboxylesterase
MQCDSLSDLHGDVKAVETALDEIRGPAIVAAHSYGGAPVTEAALGHGQVGALVYLSAFMPDVGESCVDLAGGSISPWCPVRDDGTFLIDPQIAADVLYGDCDPDTQQWALERLVPQLAATATQAIGRAAWRTTPSTYVVCGLDQAIAPSIQRRLAERATELVELSSAHSPFLSHPDAVAEIISDVADRLVPRPDLS